MNLLPSLLGLWLAAAPAAPLQKPDAKPRAPAARPPGPAAPAAQPAANAPSAPPGPPAAPRPSGAPLKPHLSQRLVPPPPERPRPAPLPPLPDAGVRVDTLAGLPALVEGPATPEVAPTRETLLTQTPFPMTQRDFGDPRVVAQWTAECGASGQWLGVDPERRGVAVGLFSQTSLWNVLALTHGGAEQFDEARSPPPPWLPPGLVEQVRAERARTSGSNGQVELAVDAWDGSRVIASYETGLARRRNGRLGPEFEPLFPQGTPRPVSSPAQAAWFDRDVGHVPPWLLQATNPWQLVELRLRSPESTTQELLTLAPREDRSSYRVAALSTARPDALAQPVISALIDGAWVVLTPQQPGQATLFHARASGHPVVGWPPPPAGASPRPRDTGAACDEVRADQPSTRYWAPHLFTWRGQAWAAVLEEKTDRSLRFAPVPRPLARPGQDELTCGWVLDTERAHTALLLGAITPDGHFTEALRTEVHAVGGTLALALRGDLLTVASSSLGSVTVTQVDLARVTDTR